MNYETVPHDLSVFLAVNIVNSTSRPAVNIIVMCKSPSGLVMRIYIKKRTPMMV